jgi:DNA (cytosine-5)-methyltransferase 1
MVGYVSYYSVLNAKDFNIPQNRERVIMVSIRKDLKQFFSFPEKEKLNLFLYDLLDKEVETKYYINTKDSNISIDKKKISYCIDANYWKGTNVENYINKKRRQLIQAGYIGKSNRETNRVYSKNGVSPTLTSMNGGNRQPKIISVERTPLRFLNRNQKNISGDYSFCIDTSNTGGVKEGLDDGSYRIRKLTPIECWRLMGYTDEDFYKAKNIGGLSDTKLYERAGRGIVVMMLEKIFYNLLISDKFKIDIEIGNSFFDLQ